MTHAELVALVMRHPVRELAAASGVSQKTIYRIRQSGGDGAHQHLPTMGNMLALQQAAAALTAAKRKARLLR